MLRAPTRPTDPLQLADWIELRSLIAPDRNASRMELQSLLRISAIVSEEEQERLILATFAELSRRAAASREAYPFSVEGSLVRLRSQRWQDYPAYVFCLLVSYVGARKWGKLDATRLFEEIAGLALSRYVDGQAEQFGFPRPTLPKSFLAAVEALCVSMKEGKGVRESSAHLSAKDEALDIVAWRPFPDGLSGKLIVFGQCAAGKNWFDKRSELVPTSFCKKWMEEQPVIDPIKAFVIPHRVETARWYHLSCDAGIVFERCRLAYFSHGADRLADHVRWSKAILDSTKK